MIKITKKEMCNGCHACSNICPTQCIEMKEGIEGFKYPEVDYDKCIKCNICIEVCPLIERKEIEVKEPKAYACFNKDEKIRMESSSGGVFTLLAKEILKDNGIVFGAAWTEKFSLKHIYITKKEDLSKFRGSKYLQSEIGETFNQVQGFLKEGRKVLFSGTPCQIGGLKSFLKHKNVNIENLLSVDFICHGVPSPKVWKKYKEELFSKEKLEEASFRDKTESWKGYDINFKSQNMNLKQKASKNKYMRAFLADICLRPSCSDCNFKGENREADITMADFWGIQNIKPEMDDDKGTSLIFTNTDLGNKYYSKISDNIISCEVNKEDAVKYNPSYFKSIKEHPKRKLYMENIEEMTFYELYNKYVKLNLEIRIKNKAKRYIGAILRKLGLR